jgi:hypothetical protein
MQDLTVHAHACSFIVKDTYTNIQGYNFHMILYVTYLLFFYQNPYYHIHMCIIEFAHMYIYYIYHYKYAFIYCIFSLKKKKMKD